VIRNVLGRIEFADDDIVESVVDTLKNKYGAERIEVYVICYEGYNEIKAHVRAKIPHYKPKAEKIAELIAHLIEDFEITNDMDDHFELEINGVPVRIYIDIGF